MSLHDATHEEGLFVAAFAIGPVADEMVAQIAGCEECLRLLVRAQEDLLLVAGAAAPGRRAHLDALLEEVLAWRSIREDGGGPGTGTGATAGVGATRRQGR